MAEVSERWKIPEATDIHTLDRRLVCRLVVVGLVEGSGRGVLTLSDLSLECVALRHHNNALALSGWLAILIGFCDCDFLLVVGWTLHRQASLAGVAVVLCYCWKTDRTVRFRR